MPDKRSFAIQTLLATVVLNGVLLVAITLLLGDALAATGQSVVVWVVGVLITLILWAIVYWIGTRTMDRVAEPVLSAPLPAKERVRPTAAAAEAPVATAVPRTQPASAPESGALQLLAIMQREGRLIDFLREDLRPYDDAQIGAAVREIHEGCRQALDDHIKLEPIFAETEGSTVSVQPGFDPRAVRLTGSVTGEPPFRGELRHRGWRVIDVDLPRPAGQGEQRILAAAEVEVQA